jgi:hypothetical protein
MHCKDGCAPPQPLYRAIGPRFGGGLFLLCEADDLGEAAVQLEVDAATFILRGTPRRCTRSAAQDLPCLGALVAVARRALAEIAIRWR